MRVMVIPVVVGNKPGGIENPRKNQEHPRFSSFQLEGQPNHDCHLLNLD